MTRNIFKTMLLAAAMLAAPSYISAQNSAARPGAGGGFRPGNGGGNSVAAPGSGGAFTPNVPQGPGPGAGFGPNVPMWGTSNFLMNGGPWGPGAYSGPIVNVNVAPNFNVGNENVVAVGYDAEGVWETIPMRVHWVWNGVNYNVTVINAWNPWTQSWGVNLGTPAFSTSYYLRGVTYNYYANLSTGTYYFNL